MARCRIGYLMALAAAGLFFVSFSDWFSFYILVLALVFPFFSLAVSLPGMLGCRVSLDAPGGAVRRGSGHEAGLRVENRWGLPVGRVAVDLSCRNVMTGQTGTVRRKGAGGSLGMDFREPLDTSHCGCLRWEVRRVRVCDLLGIFSIRRAVPQAARVLVLPLNLPAEGVKGLMGMEDKNPVMKPRPGGGPGEDYDLRPYRPGDPLRSVHWKLSSKVDDLVVRETLEPPFCSPSTSTARPRSWTGPSTGWTRCPGGSLRPSGATMSSGFSRAPSRCAPAMSPTSRSCAPSSGRCSPPPRPWRDAPCGTWGSTSTAWTGPSAAST